MSARSNKKWFVIGFFCDLFAFFCVSLYFGRHSGAICFDCTERTGFPFHAYEIGHSADENRVLWFGLIANTIMALVFGSLAGALLNWFVAKLQIRARLK